MIDTSWDPWAPTSERESFVFPPDDRFAVRATGTTRTTRQFPFNTICFLDLPPNIGSGTLIAPQVVLTVKHVLLGRSITVTPGADLGAATAALQRPFGSQVVAPARMRAHPTLDLGLLFLPRAVRQNRFMLLQPRTAANTRTTLTIAGYPDDKPIGTMWAHSDRILEVNPTELFYRIDTHAGQSGAPVWLLGNDDYRILLGVHRGFRPEASGPPIRNRAVRITCEVIDWIRARCRDLGVTGPSVDRFYNSACTNGRTIADSAP